MPRQHEKEGPKGSELDHETFVLNPKKHRKEGTEIEPQIRGLARDRGRKKAQTLRTAGWVRRLGNGVSKRDGKSRGTNEKRRREMGGGFCRKDKIDERGGDSRKKKKRGAYSQMRPVRKH